MKKTYIVFITLMTMIALTMNASAFCDKRTPLPSACTVSTATATVASKAVSSKLDARAKKKTGKCGRKRNSL